MNNKKKIRLIAVIVLALILVVEIAWVLLQKEPTDVQNQMQAGMESTATQEGQNSASDTTVPVADEGDVPTEVPDVTEEMAVAPNETEPNTKPGSLKIPQNDTTDSNYFPYSIPDSGLVIEQIKSYDGIFFEDGSDREVSNVTSMVLTNTGNNCAEYIEITIDRDGTKLQFVASALDAGNTVIVLEANEKQYHDGTYSNCVASVATSEKMTMAEKQVRVEETAEGSLLVTNVSSNDIPCVRIFYKFYMQDTDVYVGGITYTAKVVDLEAGNSCTITPSHYLKGYSKIVMVKTYDTDA